MGIQADPTLITEKGTKRNEYSVAKTTTHVTYK